jgi:SAM-dependent methyltransferase
MRSADQANRGYFREAYRTGRHGWGSEAPSPYAVKFLVRLKRAVPGGRLLDIGCGEGRHAIAAARLGFAVTAVDYEPLAIERARRWAEERGGILRALSRRGFFILSVFSPGVPLFRGRRRNWHIAGGAYRRCFTRDEILGLFGRAFEALEMIEEDGGRHGFWHVLFRRRSANEPFRHT